MNQYLTRRHVYRVGHGWLRLEADIPAIPPAMVREDEAAVIGEVIEVHRGLASTK